MKTNKKDEITTLYADIEFNSDNFFVVTPEGNYFTFRYPEYTESHSDVIIIDPTTHKNYTVCFHE